MQNTDDAKKLDEKLPKKSKEKDSEKQAKKAKSEKVKSILDKLINDLKNKKTLEEKIESKKDEPDAAVSEKRRAAKEDAMEMIKEIKYQRRARQEGITTSARRREENPEKGYSPNTSYNLQPSNYKESLPQTMYGQDHQVHSLHDIEDIFIKSGILTPNKSPTRDQVNNLRDGLRKINPGISEERLNFYEKQIISDVKERKNIYVARQQ